MTTSFQDMLKQKSAALSQQMTTPKKQYDPLECTVTVIDNIKPAELHVWFNRFPGQDIVNDLKAAGFRWNSCVWWCIDCEAKRAFCRTRLNASALEPFETPASVEPPKPEPMKLVVAPDRAKTTWEIYTQQVDELLQYRREQDPLYEASSLVIEAIAHYHKSIFAVN